MRFLFATGIENSYPTIQLLDGTTKRADEMYLYLTDNGMTREEFEFFLQHDLKQHGIMGNDYYITNEHCVFPDGPLGPRAKSSAITSLPSSISTATSCRSCTPKPTSPRRRARWNGCIRNGPT